jgi:signal transduction histidine kinase
MTSQIEHIQRLQLTGTLASGIAHDLNNELTLVLGNLQIAMGRLPNNDNARDWMNQARNAAGRCAEMSRRLLHLSGTPRPRMTDLSLNELIDETCLLLNCVKPRHTFLDIDLEPDLTLYGDAMQLQSLLLNLGMNAFHAMPKGGYLSIKTCRDLDHVRIIVSDTGCGIPPSLHKRIFEPFFTTRGEAGGSGLGLANARTIMHNHAGEISVESAPNRGATFVLEFPAQPEIEDADSEDEQPGE